VSPQRRADPGFAAGRRAKAVQFLAAADEIMDLADDAMDLKTKAGYTHRPVSAQERIQAGRRAHALVDVARALTLR
jgi:hypothetical protein